MSNAQRIADLERQLRIEIDHSHKLSTALENLRQSCLTLSQQLNDAATKHLHSEWEQDRGKGLLEAAFAVAELAKK